MSFTEFHHMPDSTILGLATVMSAGIRSLPSSAQSPFRLNPSVTRLLDERWIVRIDTGALEEDQWKPLQAFFDRMRNQLGCFSFWLPDGEVPVGVATGIGGPRPREVTFSDGTTWSDGTAALGPGNTIGRPNTTHQRGADIISIRNLSADVKGVLREGDRFSIAHGNRRIPTLYRCVADAASDSNGIAEVRIAPRLRFPIDRTSPIRFYRPRGVFQLLQQPDIQLSGLLVGQTTIEMVEVSDRLLEQEYAI